MGWMLHLMVGFRSVVTWKFRNWIKDGSVQFHILFRKKINKLFAESLWYTWEKQDPIGWKSSVIGNGKFSVATTEPLNGTLLIPEICYLTN